MSDDVIQISGEGLAASVNTLGAELWTLRDTEGRDLLWNGDASVWAGRAPILFPVVGTLNGDSYRVDGKTYSLPRHGFARRHRFTAVETDASRTVLRLLSGEETRAVYPFDFQLDLIFAITGRRLDMTAELTNTGEGPLPASFGYHPAIRWPLPFGAPRADHQIVFTAEETAPIRRLTGGLFNSAPRQSPVEGRTLALADALFAEDALIFTELAGNSLTYGVPGGPQLRIDYPDTPHLGIWTKPGAPFLCIEPWQGYSDPVGFSGDILEKPGTVRLEPGESRRWRMGVELSG